MVRGVAKVMREIHTKRRTIELVKSVVENLVQTNPSMVLELNGVQSHKYNVSSVGENYYLARMNIDYRYNENTYILELSKSGGVFAECKRKIVLGNSKVVVELRGSQ